MTCKLLSHISSDRGFTLIEVVISLAITGSLTAFIFNNIALRGARLNQTIETQKVIHQGEGLLSNAMRAYPYTAFTRRYHMSDIYWIIKAREVHSYAENNQTSILWEFTARTLSPNNQQRSAMLTRRRLVFNGNPL